MCQCVTCPTKGGQEITISEMKRTGTVLVRNDSRYNKRSRSTLGLNPPKTTKRTSNRTEVKNVFDNSDPIAVTNAGVVYTYGKITGGPEVHARIGSDVTHLGQEVIIRLDRAPAKSSAVVRLIFGVWKQASMTPGTNDILEDPLNYNLPPEQIGCPLASERSTRYRILGDEIINFPAQAAGGDLVSGSGSIASNPETIWLRRKYSYKHSQQYYGSAIGDVVDWYYFCLLVSDYNGVVTAQIMPNVFYTDN